MLAQDSEMNKQVLTEKEKNILNQLQRLVSREFQIHKLYFYGSRVRGKAKRTSDYDVLIITKDDLTWRQKRRISDLTLGVDLEFDIITDIKIYSKNDVENSILGQTPFMQNVFREGLLYG